MYSVITLQAGLAALCWIVVGLGAAAAVASPRINDILSERIALGLVCMTTIGQGCRILNAGEVSESGLLVSVSLAGYVLSLLWKHRHNLPGTSTDKRGHVA